MITMKKDFLAVFNGDSITHGGRGESMDANHIMGHGFQEMCAAEMALRYAEYTPRFVNRGIGGRNLLRLSQGWEDDVIAFRPSLLTVLIGINDCKGEEVPPEWQGMYEKLIDETQEKIPDCTIVLMEPFYQPLLPDFDAPYGNVPHPLCEPVPFIPAGNDTEASLARRKRVMTDMQKVVREIADRKQTVFVPTQARLDENCRRAPVQYFVWDGIHPSIAGHRILADAWLETVLPLISLPQ